MNGASDILNKLLSSETKGDLLVLFHKNPGLIDTMDSVARRIGKIGTSIEEDIKDLLNLGLLRSKRIGSSEVIYLDHNRDKEVQETVANYLKSLKENGSA